MGAERPTVRQSGQLVRACLPPQLTQPLELGERQLGPGSGGQQRHCCQDDGQSGYRSLGRRHQHDHGGRGGQRRDQHGRGMDGTSGLGEGLARTHSATMAMASGQRTSSQVPTT